MWKKLLWNLHCKIKWIMEIILYKYYWQVMILYRYAFSSVLVKFIYNDISYEHLTFLWRRFLWPKTICVKKQYSFSVKKEKLFEVPGFWDKFFSFRKRGNCFNKLCAALIFLVHFSIKRKRTKKGCTEALYQSF